MTGAALIPVAHWLSEVLAPARVPLIADVGAAPDAHAQEPYADMLSAEMCAVVGFDPFPGDVPKKKGLRYHRSTIGDGRKHLLRHMASPALTSLLEPDEAMLSHFPALQQGMQVVSQEVVETARLDDVLAGQKVDALKLDVQGGELMVCQGAQKLLESVVLVQVELPFLKIYRSQPSFGQVEAELRRHGLTPISVSKVNGFRMGNLGVSSTRSPYRNLRPSVDMDVVFIRDFRNLSVWPVADLKALSSLLLWMYGAVDIVLYLLTFLEHRAVVPTGVVAEFAQKVQALEVREDA